MAIKKKKKGTGKGFKKKSAGSKPIKLGSPGGKLGQISDPVISDLSIKSNEAASINSPKITGTSTTVQASQMIASGGAPSPASISNTQQNASVQPAPPAASPEPLVGLIDQKANRQIDIPQDIYNLVRLPDVNDFKPYRDTSYYTQLTGYDYKSDKWPDLYFGGSDADIIKVCVYGSDGGKIATEYLTKNKIDTYIASAIKGSPAVVKIDTGKILRDLGYRRGRFEVKFEFMRLSAGGPFPVLVNGKEKIYRGNFEQGDQQYFYASSDDPNSETIEGDKLYVKENKYIITKISGDRTEAIIAPAFIDDEQYLESFRLAAYNCINWFPEDPAPPAVFVDPATNVISFNTPENLPTGFMNGTIRIANAYFMGKRIVDEERDQLEFEPIIETQTLNPNFLIGRTLDTKFGWVGGGPWPNASAVNISVEDPVEIGDKRALRLDNVIDPNPSGQFAVKATLQNTLNFEQEYLNTPTVDGGAASSAGNPRSIGAIMRTNLIINTSPYVPMPIVVEGTQMTFSVYVKAEEGERLSLMAHADPWADNGTTIYSPTTVSNGDWQRLTLTYTLTNTAGINKLLFRIRWEPGYDDSNNLRWDPSNQSSVEQHHVSFAGAQVELGPEATDFHRVGPGNDTTIDVGTENIIKFADPDGKILIGDLAPGEEFTPNMIGGKLIVNDAHAILDLSETLLINEIDSDSVFEWDIQPSDGATGNPRTGGMLSKVNAYAIEKIDEGGDPILYPILDEGLNSQAIEVSDQFGISTFSRGYNALYWSNKYAGTADFGYHAQWVAEKGIDGGVAMWFPDLNYQDYIYDDIVAARIEAGPTDRNFEVPSVEEFADKNNYAHRFMQISTPEEDVERIGTNFKSIGALASYGVRVGDRIKVSWMQKSDPIDFEDGGRKGAWVTVNHWAQSEISPPDVPVITEEDRFYEDEAFHLYYGGVQGEFGAYDPYVELDGLRINSAPSLPPGNNEIAIENFLNLYAIDRPQAEGAGGYVYNQEGELIESEAFKWYWLSTGGSNNDESFSDDDIEDDPLVGRWTCKRLSEVIYPGDSEMVLNQYRVKGNIQGRSALLDINEYPSYDSFPTNRNISSDGVYKWNGESWVFATDGGQLDWNSVLEIEGDDATLYKRTRRLEAFNSGPVSTGHIYCNEFNQWEHAAFEFEITEFWALERPVMLDVRGHYGSFGNLYVDKLKMEVIKTSMERPEITENAVLGPLEFNIVNVIDTDKIEVDHNYVAASSEQGGLTSSIGKNKYSTFDKGFVIDYITQEQGSEDIFARYESKILDVINDQDSQKQIVVEKTYEEYGEEIGAVMSGADSINVLSANFNDYFIRYRMKDADNLYTYLITGDDSKSLITNFKPVNVEDYPGAIAYKFMAPLPPEIALLDMAFIAEEATPTLVEKFDLIPFIEEKIPPTVLRQPNWDDVDKPIRDRQTKYQSHTDLVGTNVDVRKQIEDRVLSGSLETAKINVDYSQFKNFSHFGSVEKKLNNFRNKLYAIETYAANSASLLGTGTSQGYLGNAAGELVSGSSDDVLKWEQEARKVINGFDEFENYMYNKSSSYSSGSNGVFYDNALPKYAAAGTLSDPFIPYSTTSSRFTTWYTTQQASASLYDRGNANRLINLMPEHITSDYENEEFLNFMDMIGHHYDIIWTYVKSLTDVHDRSEDITKGISAGLVEPVAESLGFPMIEGRDMVSLPQYHLGLAESPTEKGVYNVRYTQKSQKDVTREIWNRILATMPYMLKTKGTKQSLKALIAAYGIPTSILRIQEYGGPRPQADQNDFDIKQKFTKALDFNSSQYVSTSWNHAQHTTPFAQYARTNDTIEFRFKAASEETMQIATKVSASGDRMATIQLVNDGGADGRGKLKFELEGKEGGGRISQSIELPSHAVYNGEFWSAMVRRRTHHLTSSISGSWYDMALPSDLHTSQSFDLFLGYYDAGIDKVIVAESGSMTVEHEFLTEAFARTGSHHAILANPTDMWQWGGSTTDAHTGSFGSPFSGSMMEVRYWSTPLKADAWLNHVGAPKAVNGNHESSSYFDMSARFSFDDNINLNDSPNGIKDYTFTDGQLIATASGFPDTINFSSVSDRQNAFVPKIGFTKQANKLRIEANTLKQPDGSPGLLSPTERVEISSYDNAGLDSNKLGVFFAPSDVINEDIMLSLADLDFSKYLGDPRDMYNDRYSFGDLDGISDTYWKKWTTKQGFWDYMKLIKYYDLSLFDHIRRLSPARARKNIGILIESHILERPKIPVGAPPVFDDIIKRAEIDAKYAEPTSSNDFRTAEVSITPVPATSSNEFRTATVTDTNLSNSITSSNVGDYSTIALGQTGSIKASRDEFDTATFDSELRGNAQSFTLKSFDVDVLQTPGSPETDYSGSQVYFAGGGSDVLFEILQPMVTGSRIARFNQERVFFYGSNISASKDLPNSSSLHPTDVESLFTTHTGLSNLAYNGCKNTGLNQPDGTDKAVEIFDVNPYAVTVDKNIDSNLDVDLINE